MEIQPDLVKATGNKEFITAAKLFKEELKSRATKEELLQVYGLMKQATLGDCESSNKPGMLDIKGGFQYKAWLINKGMSKDEAITKSIEQISALNSKYILKKLN